MNETNKSKKYFAEVAEDWDEMRSNYFTEAMRDAAIARANLRSDAIVADVGTGTGFLIRGLAPYVAKVYGFDESSEMLEVAQRNLTHYDNVELQEAPGDALPLPDNSLDAVFGNMYLHHAPDPASAIAELVRVLRPGGQLILTDLYAHNQEWMREKMADIWLGFKHDDIRSWYANAGLTEIIVGHAEGKCSTETPDRNTLALDIFVAHGRKS